jgi:hypothetical protein
MTQQSWPLASIPLFLSSLMGLAACAWMGKPLDANPEDYVKVIVENHSFSDMNLYVERDGWTFRLGTVMSMQSSPFLLTHRMVGGATTYRLIADPIGSLNRFYTPSIKVEKDAKTYWMIEPWSWLSHVVIR